MQGHSKGSAGRRQRTPENPKQTRNKPERESSESRSSSSLSYFSSMAFTSLNFQFNDQFPVSEIQPHEPLPFLALVGVPDVPTVRIVLKYVSEASCHLEVRSHRVGGCADQQALRKPGAPLRAEAPGCSRCLSLG